ncbi:MAG: UDP-N-acetylglucosamine--N-acetylmuramyl-(pentapeptide) pyrophosphoryl-undecaprenol N-acetylglucosamine transferase [Candidatus Paceibacterota bacterium]
MAKKILLTGGGTGGHIYPLLAVAEKIASITDQDFEVDYIGPKGALNKPFQEIGIRMHSITPAKFRRYFDIKNLIDIPKFIFSLFEACFKLFFIMPDIIFSKGGPGSLAVVLASKFYFIPVIIHESDVIPSLTSRATSKVAKRIAISFEETGKYFPSSKVFLSGNPIREKIKEHWMDQESAKEYFDFNPKKPLMLVLGGSQGAETINNFIISALDLITEEFQIYHQVGDRHLENMVTQSKYFLKNKPEKEANYKVVGSLNAQDMKVAFNASDIVLSRSGAGGIFETALFKKPAILIPLPISGNDHQRANAYAYSGAGAAIVIEEANLKPSIVVREALSIISNEERLNQMTQAAEKFSDRDASELIVREMLNLLN